MPFALQTPVKHEWTIDWEVIVRAGLVFSGLAQEGKTTTREISTARKVLTTGTAMNWSSRYAFCKERELGIVTA